MLARYKIHRGKRPVDEPLPNGVRQDTRKHTRHCLRPTPEIVTAYLAEPTSAAWETFKAEYQRVLATRFAEDRGPFDELAKLAAENDVFIGCSCPTKKNPNVNHCHTMLALKFMAEHYPKLKGIRNHDVFVQPPLWYHGFQFSTFRAWRKSPMVNAMTRWFKGGDGSRLFKKSNAVGG